MKSHVFSRNFLLVILLGVLPLASCSHLDLKEQPSEDLKVSLREILLAEKERKNKEKEIKRGYKMIPRFSTGLTKKEIKSPSSTGYLNRVLTELEERLSGSKKEQELYYRHTSFMKNNRERIEFLMLPGFYEKEKWIKEKWGSSPPIRNRYLKVIRKRNVVLGMNQKEVRQSLGPPDRIFVAGQALYRNEAWQYIKMYPGKTKFRKMVFTLFFEKALVVGWNRF